MSNRIQKVRGNRLNELFSTVPRKNDTSSPRGSSRLGFRADGGREQLWIPRSGSKRRHKLLVPGFQLRYGGSLLISILAVALTYVLDSWLPQTPTLILFAAVTITAAYAGLRPALLSTLVCALSLNIFLEAPRGVPSANSSTTWHLIAFVLVAILVSAVAEHMRRIEAQARDDAGRLQILADASRIFSTVFHDQQSMLQAVVNQMAETIGDACVISLLSEDGQRLGSAAWHHRRSSALGVMNEKLTRDQRPSDEGITGKALRENRPVVITTDNPDRMRHLVNPGGAPFPRDYPIYSIISLPLAMGSCSIGALTLWRDSPGKPFTAADRELLQDLANRSAIAIEGARLSVYYQVLFKKVPEPTLVLNSDHRLLDMNPAAEKLLGLPSSRMQNKRLDMLIAGGTEDAESVYGALRDSGRWHGEMDLRHLDGESTPVEVRAVAIHLLTGPVYIWVCHDLRQQRALQQMRESFIASASHELRTPLTAALAALGLLQLPESGELAAPQRDLAKNALRNVLRLRVLVDDLLAEGQLQVHEMSMNCHPIDLREVIAAAVETLHPLLQQKGQSVELDIPEPLRLRGDAHRLEQVVVNLLANANRHTPRKSRIALTGHAVDHGVKLSVHDDGLGIPEHLIDQIFERFSPPDSDSTGTGLGLAIARELVELHGGQIWAENLPGRGAAFHILLPSSPSGA